MDISVFGLGYVGCVSLGCLAQDGNQVIGVDINSTKVDLINDGKATIVEKDIDAIIEKEHQNGRISATDDTHDAVMNSSLSIICVGTPSLNNGHLNMDYMYNTARSIGKALKSKTSFHVISIRSTVNPGTNQVVGRIIEEESGKQRNVDFAVVSNPEFLREGSAISDYYNPPYTVIGSDNEVAINCVKDAFKSINAPFKVVDIKVAEMIKYINNSFHALKVSFANEVGNICKKLGVDSHELMNLFMEDDHLNISKAYLRPGFAYGGSCLPKDLKGLSTMAHDFYLETPVISSIENSNTCQKRLVFDKILDTRAKAIGVLGISFKAGTDDLRSSPIVEVIEKLIGKGKEINIFDNNVQISRLIGKNKSFIMEKLPHIGNLLKEDITEVINSSELIIITNPSEEIKSVSIPDNKIIFDLTRIQSLENHPNYNGLSW
ncbi:MAG: UDP-glucose/GDP-mannose dehydrogenase family protein [Candidatus Atribacteria bacterium]|nr:UDP-glucose/GDP-mannose dehydrogenase family protein [Candidatus Atribacteria bacterium]